MDVSTSGIDGLMIIDPKIFEDDRGYFFEAWNSEKYQSHGIPGPQERFVQDNESRSSKGVLRGLHFQVPPFAQAKLVRVIRGKVMDIAVDMRVGSPTCGKHFFIELSAENKRQMFIPVGFAHGFVALEDETIFAYKTTAKYSQMSDVGIRFDDPELGIAWPITDPIVSEKDRNLPTLAEYLERPVFRFGQC